MSVEIVRVRIRGGVESVTQLLAGLPGDHQPDEVSPDVYDVATTNGGFLRFAVEQQGYGEVL